MPRPTRKTSGDRDARGGPGTCWPRGRPRGRAPSRPRGRRCASARPSSRRPRAARRRVVSLEDERGAPRAEEPRLDERRDQHEQARARRGSRTSRIRKTRSTRPRAPIRAARRRGLLRRAGHGGRSRGRPPVDPDRSRPRRSSPRRRRRASNSATSRPSRMTRIRSATRSTSGSSEEIIRIATPSAASSSSSRCTSAFVPTSIPRVGSSTISSDGLRASHLARTTFCWLPPESELTGFESAAVLDLQPQRPSRRRTRARCERGASRRGCRRLSEASAMLRAIDELHHEPLLAAVLGHEADRPPPSPPSASRAEARRPATRDRRRRRSESMPKIARATSLRPAPTRPASATISPARTSKQTSTKTPSRVRRSTSSTRVAEVLLASARAPAGRGRPSRARGRRRSVPASSRVQHEPAVAQHGHPLAEREDLLEPVRDEEHRGPGSRSVSTTPNSRSTSTAESAAVGSSITITPRIERERLGDLDELLLGDREAAGDPVGVEPDAEPLEDRRGLGVHRTAVDAPAGAEGLAADEDVLGDGQVGEQRRLLVDDGDPGVARGGRAGSARPRRRRSGAPRRRAGARRRRS